MEDGATPWEAPPASGYPFDAFRRESKRFWYIGRPMPKIDLNQFM